MIWKLNKEKPICPQIYELICVDIASDKLKPDQKLPSVREIAIQAGINPNTVQKAFEKLEVSGLVYSIRGTGWFIADNKDSANEIVRNLIQEKTVQYFEALKGFGMTDGEIKKYIEEWQ